MDALTTTTVIPKIPRVAKGTHVRDENPIKGDYKLFHQSIISAKNSVKIQNQKTLDTSGHVKKFRSQIPSTCDNGNKIRSNL